MIMLLSLKRTSRNLDAGHFDASTGNIYLFHGLDKLIKQQDQLIKYLRLPRGRLEKKRKKKKKKKEKE